MNRAQVAALLIGKGVLGASLVVGFGSSVASASPSGESVHIRQSAVQVSEVDYMSDGSQYVTDPDGGMRHIMKGADGGACSGAAALGASGSAGCDYRDVTESDEQWSCVDDGNRMCGPTNDEGQPAGCYDNGGVLVASWPCKPVEN